MTPTQVDRMLDAARDITARCADWYLHDREYRCGPFPVDPLTVQWARDILAANRALKVPPAPDANPDW